MSRHLGLRALAPLVAAWLLRPCAAPLAAQDSLTLSRAVALAQDLSGANSIEAVSYGTEAGLFQDAGISAVVCGPGSIDQAHKADEFVALSELEACEKFLRQVIAKAAA